MALMAFVLILATLDLLWTIVTTLTAPPYLIVTLETLLDFFGMFLLVLVGLELLDTIKAYVQEHVVHAEIVLLAAMIAVARKVIALEIKELPPSIPFGIAALVLALAAAYYLLKRAGVDRAGPRGA
jgi:uncharacterized membrane protein (DUF373 family)